MSYSLYIEAVDSTENVNIPFNKIKKDPSGRRYLDNLEEGSYKIYAQIESDSNIYTTNQIDINVAENSIETINVYRDEPELRVAGLKSNGSYFNIENYKGVNSLMKSGISMKRSTLELNVHSFHKFWFILLITLIIEWFLRKRKGLL